ncbi:class I SAM-dependent methyltransferase [Kitasatospora sp. NPDC093102]|uniref:class I SAM-dependent methyltransferase n=1 Tax=Kitasatospora sp. NPDC093102 TaxID=3155069 RepID=UPI003437164A
MSDTSDDRYAVSVEFYDLLQADDDRRRAERRFGEAGRHARHGILDIGAGTGIVTQVLLDASTVPVHAVEPATAMRTALLARLASLSADRRARVTVHPRPVEATDLEEAADLAVASNVIACLDPGTRRATWRAVSRALLPGGLLLFEPPPATLPAGREAVRRLGPVRVGPDLYSAQVTREPDRDTLRIVFTYRVERDGHVVREEREAFSMWPAGEQQLRGELEAAGLRVVRAPSRDLMAARRPSR